MNSELLNTKQLAEKLAIPVGTLAYWRYMGQGPKFIKVGRGVRYRVADVEAWLTEQTRQQAGEAYAS